MEFTQHVRMGAVFGLATMAVGAQALGITWAADVLLAPAVCAGAGEWPDADHHGSTITRIFPPITFPLHWLITWIDRFIYTITRRGDDPPAWDGYYRVGYLRTRISEYLPHQLWFLIGIPRRWDSSHRRITHSIPTAIAVGCLVGYMCAAGPWWVSALLFVTTVCLAGDLVFAGPVLAVYIAAGWVHFGLLGLLDHVHEMGPLWGLCVTIGMISHDFADNCTTYGLPLAAPVSWHQFYSPFPFDTGSFFEKVVVKWLLILLMCFLGLTVLVQWLPTVFPQGIPILSDLLHALFGQVQRR